MYTRFSFLEPPATHLNFFDLLFLRKMLAERFDSDLERFIFRYVRLCQLFRTPFQLFVQFVQLSAVAPELEAKPQWHSSAGDFVDGIFARQFHYPVRLKQHELYRNNRMPKLWIALFLQAIVVVSNCYKILKINCFFTWSSGLLIDLNWMLYIDTIDSSSWKRKWAMKNQYRSDRKKQIFLSTYCNTKINVFVCEPEQVSLPLITHRCTQFIQGLIETRWKPRSFHSNVEICYCFSFAVRARTCLPRVVKPSPHCVFHRP